MTNYLVDPVRTLRGFAQSTVMATSLRRAIEDVCNEVMSLRVETYEAMRREDDTRELAPSHTEYRVSGVLEDGRPWECDGSEGYCIDLLELLSDGRMNWAEAPQIESREVMVTPWTTA